MAFGDDIELIQKFTRQNFPVNFELSEAHLTQLTWALRHKNSTYDYDHAIQHTNVHVEIARSLTRLHCARLLRNGSRAAYQQFVQAQLEHAVQQPLTFETFNKISKHIKSLSSADYELLETSAILSAISLTKAAADSAKRIIDIKSVQNDNLEFMATTLRQSQQIYPLLQPILQNHNAAQKLLWIIFPPQTNFRHMLYTEGGIGMFQYLRVMIKHGYIKRESLDVWYGYWLINMAGFRGHVAQHGSLYLTEPVALATQELRAQIYEMLQAPNYDPLVPYLEYRAKLLGLTHLRREQRLTLAHLGALMRLYTIAEGQMLHKSFEQLQRSEQQAFQIYFLQSLTDSRQPTPTYAPALFCNALALTDNDIKQVVHKLLPVYNLAIKQARQQQFKFAVSFNDLSAQNNLRRLLRDDPKCVKIRIAPNGNVIY